MTLGGISFSLNSTLARLNAIESNFQALNNVAFDIDLKQTGQIQGAQNPDFKAVLDSKTNQSENNSKETLPIYDDEIEPVKTEEITETTSNDNDLSDIKEYKKDSIELKSKVGMKDKNANIDEIIETFSNKYNVDFDFIKAIINQESGFNKNATSKKGAMGLMQLMPKTAESLGVVDAYNPWENIEGGVKHLKGLLDKYSNNPELALAAYNAGEGAVRKYGGIPPYKETQNYVKSIMAAYQKTKEAKI